MLIECHPIFFPRTTSLLVKPAQPDLSCRATASHVPAHIFGHCRTSLARCPPHLCALRVSATFLGDQVHLRTFLALNAAIPVLIARANTVASSSSRSPQIGKLVVPRARTPCQAYLPSLFLLCHASLCALFFAASSPRGCPPKRNSKYKLSTRGIVPTRSSPFRANKRQKPPDHRRAVIQLAAMAVNKRKRGSTPERRRTTGFPASVANSSSSPPTREPAHAPDPPAIQPAAVAGPKPESAKRLKRGRTREELDAVRASETYATAVTLVEFLLADPVAAVFSKPVLDMWSVNDLPGYFDTIEIPMDLGTVLKRTRLLEYICERSAGPNSSATVLDFDDAAFFEDVRRVFKNSMLYNDSKSDFYRNARRLLGMADRRFSVRTLVHPPVRRAVAPPLSFPSAPPPAASSEVTPASARAPVSSPRVRDRKAATPKKVVLSALGKPLVGAAAKSAAASAARAARAAAASAAQDSSGDSGKRGSSVATITGPGRPASTQLMTYAPAPTQNGVPRVTAIRQIDKVNEGAVVVGGATRDAEKAAAKIAASRADAAAAIAAETAEASKAARKAASLAASAYAATNGTGGARSSSVPGSTKNGWGVTSSISSDELEANGDPSPEPQFAFVSTKGMEKKRGRKSAVVQDLEVKHDQLSKRRKMLLDSAADLEQRKMIPMTFEEKAALCDKVSVLDFVQMKAVVDIIARGMDRQDILDEVEVDMDIDGIDNKVLREIEAFLNNSTLVAAHGTLRSVDEEMTEIESQLVDIRYQKLQ
jgi:Bromodomain extra-terminal - transcription regulation/Bromodomain